MAKKKQPIRVTDVGDFLLHTGLLFEINRRILHPLGLAMEVEFPSDGGNSRVSAIWDCRKDPEGVVFEEKTFQAGSAKYKKYMNTKGTKALASRKEKLGYLEQTE